MGNSKSNSVKQSFITYATAKNKWNENTVSVAVKQKLLSLTLPDKIQARGWFWTFDNKLSVQFVLNQHSNGNKTIIVEQLESILLTTFINTDATKDDFEIIVFDYVHEAFC